MVSVLEHELGESQMNIEDFEYMSKGDKVDFLKGSLADAEYYCGKDEFKTMRKEIKNLNLDDFIYYNAKINYKNGYIIVDKAGLKKGDNQKAIAECSFYNESEVDNVKPLKLEFDVPDLEKYFEELFIKEREHLLGHSEVLVKELKGRLIEDKGYIEI